MFSNPSSLFIYLSFSCFSLFPRLIYALDAMNKLGNMPGLISYTTSECIIAADIVYFGSFADTCKCLCNESYHRKFVVKARSLWSGQMLTVARCCKTTDLQTSETTVWGTVIKAKDVLLQPSVFIGITLLLHYGAASCIPAVQSRFSAISSLSCGSSLCPLFKGLLMTLLYSFSVGDT